MWLYLALATAILWGLTYASTEQVVKFMDVKTYLTYSCLVGAFLYLTWGGYDGTLLKDYREHNLWKGIGFATLSSLCAFAASYCSVAAVKSGGATYASIVEISYPIWVVIFIYLLTGVNTLSWNVLGGGLLIFIGTIVVMVRK